MKFLKNNKYVPIGITAFITVACIILLKKLIDNFDLFGAVGTLVKLLMPFMIGFAFAYLLNPMMKFFEKKCFEKLFHRSKLKSKHKLVRALSVLFTIVVALAALTAVLLLLIPQLLVSITGVVNNLPIYIANMSDSLENLVVDNKDLAGFLDQRFNEVMDYVQGMITGFIPSLTSIVNSVTVGVLGVLNALKDFVLGIIISVYVLYAKERFIAQAKKVVTAITPQGFSKSLIGLAKDTHVVFGGFISGKIIDSLIIGVMCFIGVSLMGMPYAVLISVIVGVFNVIPFFGPFIGAIPSALLILFEDPIKCIWFIIFIICLQQFDGNILGPAILGESTGLSAFWVIFSILVAGGLFGFLGMFVGVPVFAVIYTLISKGINTRLETKGLSTNTNDYLYTNSKGEDSEEMTLQ